MDNIIHHIVNVSPRELVDYEVWALERFFGDGGKIDDRHDPYTTASELICNPSDFLRIYFEDSLYKYEAFVFRDDEIAFECMRLFEEQGIDAKILIPIELSRNFEEVSPTTLIREAIDEGKDPYMVTEYVDLADTINGWTPDAGLNLNGDEEE